MATYQIDTSGDIMTMNELHVLQKSAIQLLLNEVFQHVFDSMQEQYLKLGKCNAQLMQSTSTFFLHKGTVYPEWDKPQAPYGLPTLHYSLLSEFDAIEQTLDQEYYQDLKNFFTAVIGQSANGIVLEALLPSMLFNTLKTSFFPIHFNALDTGVYFGLQQEPLLTTQQKIHAIKTHYKQTVTTLQHILMDKLLLQ